MKHLGFLKCLRTLRKALIVSDSNGNDRVVYSAIGAQPTLTLDYLTQVIRWEEGKSHIWESTEVAIVFLTLHGNISLSHDELHSLVTRNK